MGSTVIPFSLPTAGSFLSGIFFVAILLAVIFSAILLYHWIRYGKHAINMSFVVTAYFAGVVVFLGMMLSGL